MKEYRGSIFAVITVTLACVYATAQQASTGTLSIDWSKKVSVSRSTPTLQVVVNPQILRGALMHDCAFAALHALGAYYVRYVPWLPYPRQAVAELAIPAMMAEVFYMPAYPAAE